MSRGLGDVYKRQMFPYRAYNRVAFTDKEVSWYADGGDPNAAVQLNATTYYYLAIG